MDITKNMDFVVNASKSFIQKNTIYKYQEKECFVRRHNGATVYK